MKLKVYLFLCSSFTRQQNKDSANLSDGIRLLFWTNVTWGYF